MRCYHRRTGADLALQIAISLFAALAHHYRGTEIASTRSLLRRLMIYSLSVQPTPLRSLRLTVLFAENQVGEVHVQTKYREQTSVFISGAAPSILAIATLASFHANKSTNLPVGIAFNL